MPKIEMLSSTNKILKPRLRGPFTRSNNSRCTRKHQNAQNNHENNRFSHRIFTKNHSSRPRRKTNDIVYYKNVINDSKKNDNNIYKEINGLDTRIDATDCMEDVSNNSDRCQDDVNGNFNKETDGRLVNGTLPSPKNGCVAVGNFTREVYDAICLRLGDTSHIPEDSVQAVFNDMHLFPSSAQITKMLQCARQYGRRNGANQNYLTFGELCFLIREMQNQISPKQSQHKKVKEHQVQQLKTTNNNKCPANKCEVFLGGSCNPTTWREDTAIPELEKQGISFYNPQVSIWAPELLAQEHDAKQSASVLLFVIDSQTRSTVGMLEVAYLVASGRCVIVVAQPYRRGQTIMGEIISDKEYVGLVEGQRSLLDLVKSRGVQIHTSLSTALQCTANTLQSAMQNGTTVEEQLVFKLRKLREVYDSYNGQMRFYDILDAYKKITDRTLEIDKLYNYLSPQNGNTITNTSITFEKFCTLMAELSTDGCQMCTNAGRVYVSPLYWSCALLKTRYVVQNIVVRPISHFLGWATQPFQRQCTTNNNKSNCIVEQPLASPPPLTAQPTRSYDVYLGGSLSTGCHWREDVAIPLLKKNGSSYYNPAIREQNGTSTTETHPSSECRVSEMRQNIDRSQVALFVVTNDTRSLTTMVLAAHYMGAGKDVVLCVQQLTEGCVVQGEMLTKNAVKDYNRARAYLRDVAERKQIPVFESVADAVESAVERVRTPR